MLVLYVKIHPHFPHTMNRISRAMMKFGCINEIKCDMFHASIDKNFRTFSGLLGAETR